MSRKRVVPLLLAALAVAGGSVMVAGPAIAGAWHQGHHQRGRFAEEPRHTATPIRHVVVIFQENVSFDHYFGTYPYAAGTDGQRFTARTDTPAVDGLAPATEPVAAAEPAAQHQPAHHQPQQRRCRSGSTAARSASPGSAGGQLTCDQDHNYSDEQQAFDGGKMDQFVQSVGTGGGKAPFGTPCNPNTVMDYYDGNTVTGLWNYAQHFAMSDNSYSTTFGPSSPGAINLVSGDTGNVDMAHTANSPSIATSTEPERRPDRERQGRVLADQRRPAVLGRLLDPRRGRAARARTSATSSTRAASPGDGSRAASGRRTSYPDALAATGHSGQSTSTFTPDEFKSAGFAANRPCRTRSNQGICDAVHPVGVALGGTGQWGYKDDYIPHHEPFKYYASTANPHHLTIPTDASGNDTLGRPGDDRARHAVVTSAAQPQFDTPNHQYDIERLRPARVGDLERRAAAVGPAGGQLPQGPGLPGRPRGVLRPGRRAAVRRQRDQRAVSTRRTGSTPRWSSPTTTPTAGTTTPYRGVRTRRCRRRTT